MTTESAYGLARERYAAFGVDVDAYSDWVKASPPAPGFESVQLPGDPERRSATDRQANGIPVDGGTLAELLAAAKSAGVPQGEIDTFAGGNFSDL